MSTVTSPTVPDDELKARHRTMWAAGDYPTVAREVIADLGPTLVEACGVGPGDDVIDVAAGSGNVAVPAAETGATVVATDLTPELFEAGRAAAADRGVSITWVPADAEAMPCDDDSYDVTLSCVGVMFAPHHQAAADELVRITRPGGRIGLISWTPSGFIGQLFATMKPFAPAPPAGVQPAPLWGDESHVRELLGDRVTDLTATRRLLDVGRFATPADFRDFFKTNYGPTLMAYRSLGDDAARVAALDEALDDLAARNDLGHGRLQWEYLLVTARKA